MTLTQIFLLALTITSISSVTNFKCVGSTISRAFNIKPIDPSEKATFTKTLQNYKDTDGKTITASFVWNVCKGVETKPAECSTQVASSVYIIKTVNGTKTCSPLTPYTGSKAVSFNYKVNGESNSDLEYTIKSTPKDSGVERNVEFKIKCNSQVNNSSDLAWTVTQSENGTDLVFTTGYYAGCGNGVEDLMKLFQTHKYITAPLFFCFGIILCFFGNRFFKYTLMICGFLIGFMSVLLVCYMFNVFERVEQKGTIVILVIALAMGILGGYIFYKFETLTVMAACGILFFFIAWAIFTFFLTKQSAEWNKWLVLAIQIGVGCIGAIFGYYAKKLCLIVSTAFGGAFLAIASITLFVPPPSYKQGEPINATVYVWGGFWLLLSIVGLFIQVKFREKKENIAKGQDQNELHSSI